MHAIQTSGNCVRNITSDHFAGVAATRSSIPRPYCELIRQWSTLHPEFAFLPRKFKIAVTGATNDRAGRARCTTSALHAGRRTTPARSAFACIVGGGMGRTPIIGHVDPRVPAARGDPQLPRRDPARLQPLRPARQQVQGAHQDPRQGAHARSSSRATSRPSGRTCKAARRPFPTRRFERLAALLRAAGVRDASQATIRGYRAAIADNRAFGNWVKRNVHPHKVPGYAIVTLSLKRTGVPPGDATSDQMDAIADLADRYQLRRAARLARAEPDPARRARRRTCFALWTRAEGARPRDAQHRPADRHRLLPGRRLLLARQREVDPDRRGDPRAASTTSTTCTTSASIDLNISGCMNACGHHHIGHIGILGVDKNGGEWYQVSIGGAQGNDAALGKVIGPSFAADEMPDVVERLIDTYIERRHDGRALHRHRAPRRHRALQGTRLCHDSLGIARSSTTATRCCARRRRSPTFRTACRSSCRSRSGSSGARALIARGETGVWLAPADDPGCARRRRRSGCRVIAIDFPQFTDGRGYSHARLLRERYRYAGELRAIGDVAARPALLPRAMRLRCVPDPRRTRCRRMRSTAFADFSDGYQATPRAHRGSAAGRRPRRPATCGSALRRERMHSDTGTVYLVGAGPGAPDLLTVRAANLLARADIVFHDALVHPDTLALATRATKIAVGKRCGKHSTAQRFINKRLVDAARDARRRRAPEGRRSDAVRPRAGGNRRARSGGRAATKSSPASPQRSRPRRDLGTSLTQRGACARSRSSRRASAKASSRAAGSTASADADAGAIYMGSARSTGDRRGADRGAVALPATPVAIVEDASLPRLAVHYTTLGRPAGVREASIRRPDAAAGRAAVPRTDAQSALEYGDAATLPHSARCTRLTARISRRSRIGGSECSQRASARATSLGGIGAITSADAVQCRRHAARGRGFPPPAVRSPARLAARVARAAPRAPGAARGARA